MLDAAIPSHELKNTVIKCGFSKMLWSNLQLYKYLEKVSDIFGKCFKVNPVYVYTV